MSKKVLITSIIIIAIGIILFSFKTGKNNNVSEDGVISTTTSSAVGGDFVKALLGVNTISLDMSLLNSPAFNSLDASGAFVDPNPEKGRTDPFSSIGKEKTETNTELNTENVSRSVTIGVNTVANAEIIISKITTTTASITVRGLSGGEKVSAILLGANDSLISVPSFNYKQDGSEYSSVVTGLVPKMKYTVRLQSPENTLGLQAEFTTR